MNSRQLLMQHSENKVAAEKRVSSKPVSVLLKEAQKFHTLCRSMHASNLLRIYVRDVWNLDEVPMNLTVQWT